MPMGINQKLSQISFKASGKADFARSRRIPSGRALRKRGSASLLFLVCGQLGAGERFESIHPRRGGTDWDAGVKAGASGRAVPSPEVNANPLMQTSQRESSYAIFLGPLPSQDKIFSLRDQLIESNGTHEFCG